MQYLYIQSKYYIHICTYVLFKYFKGTKERITTTRFIEDPSTNSPIIIGGAVGGAALLLISGLLVFVCIKKSQAGKKEGM